MTLAGKAGINRHPCEILIRRLQQRPRVQQAPLSQVLMRRRTGAGAKGLGKVEDAEFCLRGGVGERNRAI